MKKLQNNFTTPEQSKRLLELGLPADSADLVYLRTPDTDYDPFVVTDKKPSAYREALPCWSVGRLIDIYELCYAQEYIRDVGTPLMEDVFSAIYDAINDTTEQWDFSKLEERV